MRVPGGSEEAMVRIWTGVDVTTLLRYLDVLRPAQSAVIASDGRSGAGKSTLASIFAAAVPEAAVVATDDVAWHYSMFDWTAELITNVIGPVRLGQPVRYRPPGWIARIDLVR